MLACFFLSYFKVKKVEILNWKNQELQNVLNMFVPGNVPNTGTVIYVLVSVYINQTVD